MAKFYFNYGPMNSGKSQNLINTVYNYRNQSVDGIPKKCLVFTTKQDTRSGKHMIRARNGSSVLAEYVDNNIFNRIQNDKKGRIYAVVVDEAQFLTLFQVQELSRVVDELNIPVICFGLKTDFQNKLFSGSKALFEYVDKLTESKTICFECSTNKATMNLRLDKNGNPVDSGKQLEPGDNYIPVCRKCYKKMISSWEKFNK